MASPAKLRFSKSTFHLPINLRRNPPQNLSFSLLSRDPTKSIPVRFPVIRASSSPPSNPKPSLLKKTCITLTAAAALFSASYYIATRPPAITPQEATLEKHLETESNDVEALLSLAEIKFNSRKHDQAISILNRMIEINPDKQEWLLMRARMLSCNYESESAIKAFEEILTKDPNSVEAYHYLVMEYHYSIPKLNDIEMKIYDAIGRYKKMKKKTKEIRDLRLLIAQIKIIEGYTDETIWICEELTKEDPEDFRTYMLQGFTYVLMKKEDEAMKLFEQCGTMFPKDHLLNGYENGSIPSWSMIVAYDGVLCYLVAFAKLFVALVFP